MTFYKRTKRDNLLKFDRLSNELWISKDHELNKEKLRSIIETAELLLRLEDMQIACENGDLEGTLKYHFSELLKEDLA